MFTYHRLGELQLCDIRSSHKLEEDMFSSPLAINNLGFLTNRTEDGLEPLGVHSPLGPLEVALNREAGGFFNHLLTLQASNVMLP